MVHPLILERHNSCRISYTDINSIIISFYVCGLVVITFIMLSDRCVHWFLIPLLLCGILIGIDAVDWLSGRVDKFDPVGIIGLLGLHLFFLAPLLHVSLDYWTPYIIPPEDWREWLGGMAVLNFLGLLMYRFSRNIVLKSTKKIFKQKIWRLDRKGFAIILSVALTVTGCLQIWVYIQQGGIFGYITSYLEREGAFRGMGWVFMISESFPILAIIGFAVYAKKNKLLQRWQVLLLVLVAFFITKMLFGGLRGSRSNTIWGLFWAVGIIHFWIRPIPKKMIFFGMIFLFLFVYLYGFYKGAGLDALEALKGADVRAELIEKTGRSFEDLVLHDLGRSEFQAFLLYRLLKVGSDYEYAWGRTYLGAAAILIPRAIWPDRPPHKVKEGTEAFYGMGTYIPGRFESSRLYGLAGEAMLNFSPIAVPFIFVILGLIVARVRYLMNTLETSDSRLLLLPFLINFCYIILVGDSDNTLFFFIKNGALPFFVVTLCSKKLLLRTKY